MSFVEREGVKIYYEDAGEGPPVLLSHGYSATSQMWEAQVAALKSDYRVVTWDMRGHGRTDSPEDASAYSEDATVLDMRAILEECGISRAVVGGLSLGGYMSLGFYCRYPEVVSALMLFDTGPGYRNDEARDQWNDSAEVRAKQFEAKGLDALGSSDEVRASTHTSPAGLAGAARGMLAQCDSHVMEILPEITVPTLVLVGADDKPFIGATDYMERKIAGAKKVVLADAGHAANLHQPEAFNDAVSEFLAGLN